MTLVQKLLLWVLLMGLAISAVAILLRLARGEPLPEAVGWWLDVFLGNNNRRALTFIGTLPFVWIYAIFQPLGPALFDGEVDVIEKAEIVQETILSSSRVEKARLEFDTFRYGKETADRLAKERQQKKTPVPKTKRAEPKDPRRDSWWTWWGVWIITVGWTIFVVVYVLVSPREEVAMLGRSIRDSFERRQAVATAAGRPREEGDRWTRYAVWIDLILGVLQHRERR